MRPFAYRRADTPDAAIAAVAAAGTEARFLGGGTTLLDLMKLDVMRPETLVDVTPAEAGELGRIEADAKGLRLGALVRMADAAEHPAVRRDYPVIAQSLALAASQQLRVMARLGGNVLQRTRCPYFRDTSWAACNKRAPGSGCAARQGVNRLHAILGTSEACIASYPGDFAQALMALDATVEVLGPSGARTLPFAELHHLPGNAPHLETTLAPGELITGFTVEATPWTRRSLYLKVRDRESYAFALASAAVALDLDGEDVREARIGLGGVATVPWRATAAESALRGRRLDAETAEAAAAAAFEGAELLAHNGFKADLGRRTVVRALLAARDLEV